MQLSQEELNNKIRNLPQDLRDAFFSDEITQAMQGLGKKHQLTIDKMGAMYEDVNNIILGLAHPNDFVKQLSQHLEVTPEKARLIADDINKAIFQPIRDSLKKVHHMEPAEPPKPTTPPVQPIKPTGPTTPLSPQPAEAVKINDANAKNKLPPIKELPKETSMPFWKKPIVQDTPIPTPKPSIPDVKKIIPAPISLSDEIKTISLGEQPAKPRAETIFAKPLTPPAYTSPAATPEPAKTKTPAELQSDDDAAAAAKKELEKVLNYSGKDPYRESVE
ncbi:hypothetical protein HYT01_01675 [Candidatus Giovannonibacteria bacterium]|nr:hypothetical protein [Candidatus Giovannonibacteria bacterium]